MRYAVARVQETIASCAQPGYGEDTVHSDDVMCKRPAPAASARSRQVQLQTSKSNIYLWLSKKLPLTIHRSNKGNGL